MLKVVSKKLFIVELVNINHTLNLLNNNITMKVVSK